MHKLLGETRKQRRKERRLSRGESKVGSLDFVTPPSTRSSGERKPNCEGKQVRT